MQTTRFELLPDVKTDGKLYATITWQEILFFKTHFCLSFFVNYYTLMWFQLSQEVNAFFK